MSFPVATFLSALAALVAFAPRADAQDSTACNSCASCTSALAGARARVHLESDFDAAGTGACVTIAGANAQFDGRGHTIRENAAGQIAVQVTGAGVLVRNVHASGPGIGIDIANAERTTILRAALETRDIGVRVNSARSPRIVRAAIHNARIGVAFGQPNGTTCAPAALASPGAVISRSMFERNTTAIAACDAAPVLTDNVIVRNQVGVILGAPSRGSEPGPAAEGPYDPCMCAPSLDHVEYTTTLFYSSGCGGCQVHEGWLPDLRRSGHDIRVRETGLEHVQEGQRFDDYMAQCVPEITDSLGIPGCVPNYACQANDTVFKMREGADQLRYEARLDSSEDVAHFAESCAAFARAHYRSGASCVRHAVRGNVVCSNRGGDIVAAEGARRYGGAGNACGTANGWADENATGCAQPCPSTLPTTADAPSPVGQPTMVAHAPAPAAQPEGAPAPQPAAAPAPTPSPATAAAPSANAPRTSDAAIQNAPAPNAQQLKSVRTVIMVGCIAGILGLIGFALKKGS
jgi:hypothetical protein